jgi:hypothetical protein
MLFISCVIRYCLSAASLLLIVGCGGGAGSAPSLTSFTISGTAATGAAISNGTVDAKCKTGTGTTTSNFDGTFTIEITNGALPCILKAVDPVTKLELHSVAELGAKRANISPVTELVTANLLSTVPSTVFATFTSDVHAKITTQSVENALKTVQLATVALGRDADMSNVDVLKGNLSAATELASGDANDKKIDALMSALAAADKNIRDLTMALKSATQDNARTTLLSVVGEAADSLESCPNGRTGDVWIFGTNSGDPIAYRVDFKRMLLIKKSTGAQYPIELVRDTNQNLLPCAFKSSISGYLYEYRITEGGLTVAYTPTGGVMIIPLQKSLRITDAGFAGSYPAMAFVRSKASDLRFALPIRFEIDSNGNLSGFACDLTKSPPDCIKELDSSNKDDVSCIFNDNGLYECESTASGFQSTAAIFQLGSQATMLMSIKNMNVAGASYSGVVVMTKAVRMTLPVLGSTVPINLTWFVSSTGSSVTSGYSTPRRVTAVNSVARTYSASATPVGVASALTTNYFLDTPANGFVYWKNVSSEAIQIRSKGWALSAVKPQGSSYYSTWIAHMN